ncbi:MAG: hypothetical protein HY722_10540 [Planctomycetes bacterium]|nr:hypothetical protein [Planctomycetota bacterium]
MRLAPLVALAVLGAALAPAGCRAPAPGPPAEGPPLSAAPRARWRAGERWHLRVRWLRREPGPVAVEREGLPGQGEWTVESEREVPAETRWACEVVAVDPARAEISMATEGRPRTEVVRLTLALGAGGAWLSRIARSTRYEWGEERAVGAREGREGLCWGEDDGVCLPPDLPLDFPLIYAPGATPRPSWTLPDGSEVREAIDPARSGIEFVWELTRGMALVRVRQHWEDGEPWWSHHVREEVVTPARGTPTRRVLVEAWREP